MGDPFWSAVITAIISAIVGGIAGGLVGYYSAKRVAIGTETRADIDMLREEALKESATVLRATENATVTRATIDSSSEVYISISWADYTGLPPREQFSALEYTFETIDLYNKQLSDCSARINALMPKNPKDEPYYHQKLKDRLTELEERSQHLEELKIKVQSYLD